MGSSLVRMCAWGSTVDRREGGEACVNFFKLVRGSACHMVTDSREDNRPHTIQEGY